jgi:hypothetical protein
VREPQNKVIEGYRYQVTVLPAGKGLTVLARLGRSFSTAGSAASVTAVDMDPATADLVFRELAACSMVEASPGSGNLVPLADVFDLHFAGEYMALFSWFAFAIEVNFGPLFKRPAAGGARGGSGAAAK